MKSAFAFTLLLAATAVAADPEPPKPARSSVPGPYPAIIQMTPAPPPAPGQPEGIIQSDLGGRELQFMQSANQAGRELLALTELTKGRSASEQIKAVAEMLASTQATETQEVARLAGSKKIALESRVVHDPAELDSLSGAKFEKAWVERLIAVNESSVAAYENGAKSHDADVRSFAEKMLPVAQARLQMAQRLGGRPTAAPSAPPAAPKQAAAPAPAKSAKP